MSTFTRFAFYFVIVGAIFTTSKLAHSQARPSSATQVASLDFIGHFEGYGLMAQYEWKASPLNSWALRAFYWPSDDAKWSAFGVGGAYRFYVADSRALTGLSVAPAASVHFFKQNANGGVSGMALWIAGDLAYKWIFSDFSVEPMVELGIGFGPSRSGSTGVPAAATGAKGVVRVSGGYAW